jgi:hypothetical protein
MRIFPTPISEKCEVNRGLLAGLQGVVTAVESSGNLRLRADDFQGVYVLLPATSLSLTTGIPLTRRRLLDTE